MVIGLKHHMTTSIALACTSCRDGAEGTDLAAVKGGWVSVTPLRVVQDISALTQKDAAASAAFAVLVTAAGKHANVECCGVP